MSITNTSSQSRTRTKKQRDGFGTALRNSLPALTRLQSVKEKELISPELLRDVGRISEVTLAIVGAVGATALTVIMPNIWTLLPLSVKLSKQLKAHPRKTQAQIIRSFYYLKRHGYIQVAIQSNGERSVTLTAKGKDRYDSMKFNALRVPKPGSWNGHWWCVAADIPTQTHRHAADLLRAKLKKMQFATLQRSLWVHPFDPRNEINIVAAEYQVGHYVTIFEITTLDQDDEIALRAHCTKQHIF